MCAAEFLYRNQDSADPFWRRNMTYGICRFCELSPECKKSDNMPIISPLSRYAIRWHNELKTVPIYPVAGSWEQQPIWFMTLIAQAANVYNKLERQEHNATQGKK